jgi:acetyl-CoA carboxylase biotin carboxyl carrier protein
MDTLEKIRQLVALMDEKGLAELEVQEPELRIKIKTNLAVQYSAKPAVASAPSIAATMPVTAPAPPDRQVEPTTKPASPPEEATLKIVSPMVGTFYRAPSEGAEPYVTVGTIVEPDTVVCIIEAMKVMNEIKAEVSGEVVEILVQNGEPVEYGQVLFLVKPISK